MRLTDLAPIFLRHERDAEGRELFHRVDSLAEAQGIRFLCPACFAANGGPSGTHQVVCWSRSRGAPDDATPGPGRWTLEGSSAEDLTLGCEPGLSRSVQTGCWHGYVTGGAVTAA